MGIAANKFRLLYLTASKSDIEYKIFVLNRKRMALLDSSSQAAANFADSAYQSGGHTGLHDGELPGIFPWMSGSTQASSSNPFFGGIPETPAPSGDYEAENAVIHAMDRELELKIKELESFYEAKKTEMDSVKEMLKKNTQKEFKTFNG